MNRINTLFQTRRDHILSIYFTAGYPQKESTADIIHNITKAGADMIEIGIPFSDPLADGPVIQNSSSVALSNGMSLSLLFEQIKDIRKYTSLPLILMGYLNPVLQYGIEAFCRDAEKCGIDGLIIPDLPVAEFLTGYRSLMEKFSLNMIFLISPRTDTDRIRMIDAISDSFLYLVTSSGTTGGNQDFDQESLSYFDRIKKMNLKNPLLAGFGISNRDHFETICRYVHGGIIGSSFIKAITGKQPGTDSSVHEFIKSIRS